MISGHEERFRALGFVTPDWELHILARPMDADHPIPPPDPSRVVLADPPRLLSSDARMRSRQSVTNT